MLLMLLTGACWTLAGYGVTIVGFLLPGLQAEWDVSPQILSYLAAAGMLGMVPGSVIAGRLADRFGRRQALTLVMLYLGGMFILHSLSWNIPALIILRFLSGMGMGAILPPAGALVTEFSPANKRGMLVVLLNGFWGLGGTLSAAMGYFVVLKAGWRPAILFGGVAILIAFLVRFLLPESLRYLISKGRSDEAYRESNRIRLDGKAEPSTNPGVVTATSGDQKQTNPEGVWSRAYVRVTLALWWLWFALNYTYQGIYVWLPTLLFERNNSIGQSYLLALFISLGQLPGTVLISLLADRFSRRKLIILTLGLLAVFSLLFGLSANAGWVMVVGFAMMISNGMVWGLAHPFSNELYPTRMRGYAVGWAVGFGRVGGAVAPFIIGLAAQMGASIPLLFGILTVAPISTMLILANLKQETTGRNLEEISETPA